MRSFLLFFHRNICEKEFETPVFGFVHGRDLHTIKILVIFPGRR